MTRRAVSISLKIPDNEAYTALVALRRLGIDLHRVERSRIYLCDDRGDLEALEQRFTADETIFNPNKHRLTILDGTLPRAGEVWIEPLSHPKRLLSDPGQDAVAWRLYDSRGAPVSRAVLDMAIKRLLCNPAIDRAVTADTVTDRDISVASE
jgi:hypothetical protein